MEYKKRLGSKLLDIHECAEIIANKLASFNELEKKSIMIELDAILERHLLKSQAPPAPSLVDCD